MNRVAKFEKVPVNQFIKDWLNAFKLEESDSNIENASDIWENIRLPERATTGSAGYDFFAPANFEMVSGDTLTIPTGIRVTMDPSYVLMIFPRSGLGFKHRLQLDNTVGIIDSDYYYTDNYGHIHIKVSKDSYEYNRLMIQKGSGFAQGIFIPFGVTIDDRVTEIRIGGFGSTTKTTPAI